MEVDQSRHTATAATDEDADLEVPPRTLPQQIFILSGQSNMAGRGGVRGHHWDHVVPPLCRPSPFILRFSGRSKWVVARDPLHADIDVRKTCGVGPGMAFANSLLQIQASSTASPPAVMGLVPCAVGGTAIAEWERGTKHYGDMLRRAREASAAAGDGDATAIKAVLWYQGESDTDSQQKADAYREKIERLILNVRSDLGLPSLPFIQVALASGVEPRLVDEVRKAQLGIDLPDVACVDAKGLALNGDNLHLTTDSQVLLGKMLARAYASSFCSSSS